VLKGLLGTGHKINILVESQIFTTLLYIFSSNQSPKIVGDSHENKIVMPLPHFHDKLVIPHNQGIRNREQAFDCISPGTILCSVHLSSTMSGSGLQTNRDMHAGVNITVDVIFTVV
jgi:hypothetical protein